MKIHRSNMAHSLIRSLDNRIKNVETWDVRVHVDKRMFEKSLKFDLLSIIAKGEIVELHDNAGTDRIVLELNNGSSRDSVVLDLNTHEIITAWSRDNNIIGRNSRDYLGS